jgi:hypothetical protein
MKRLWLLVAIVAAACTAYDPNKYVVGPDDITKINAILNLTVEPGSVAADGLSSVVVTATLDPQSSKKEVQFTATDGTFTVGAQPDPKTAKVTADAAGRAVTELRSSTTVGTVKVDASVTVDPAQPAIRRTVNVGFVVPSADGLLTLAASAPTMPADNFSRVTITGTLKVTSGTPAQRQIQFKSNEGLLYAAGFAANTTQTIPVGVDGNAIVEIESTKNLRDAHVTASISGVTREIVVRQTAVDPSAIITLSPSSASAPADGVTLTRITARIAAGLPSGKRTVTFSVTPNTVTISPSSQTADSGNQVFADITSLKVTGPVRITATVDNTTAQTTVQLVPALPDRIIMTSAAPTVAPTATDSVQITATLQREVGTVTQGTNVVFEALDVTGSKVGSFAQNSVTDANGVATALFFPGLAATPGPVTITAKVDGAAAVGSIRILVQ